MVSSPDALAKAMTWSYAMYKNAQPKVSGLSDDFELDIWLHLRQRKYNWNVSMLLKKIEQRGIMLPMTKCSYYCVPK